MTIDYYYMALSPPCRSVMMTAKMLGVEMVGFLSFVFHVDEHLHCVAFFRIWNQ